LSSIEGFARSLEVHRRTVVAQRERHVAAAGAATAILLEHQAELLTASAGPDDELEGTDEERDQDEVKVVADLTVAVESNAPRDAPVDEALWAREQRDVMEEIAQASRFSPDTKLRALIDWIREHQCPGLPEFGHAPERAARVDAATRADLHREPRRHEALPEDDARAGDRQDRSSRRADRGGHWRERSPGSLPGGSGKPVGTSVMVAPFALPASEGCRAPGSANTAANAHRRETSR
jgi:hypothetical protein